MSSQIPEGQLSPIKEALFAGRKIEAIKLYRKATSVDLAEAKKAVDKLEQELRVSAPDKFISAPAGKGCSAIVVAVFVCLLITVGYLLVAHRL